MGNLIVIAKLCDDPTDRLALRGLMLAADQLSLNTIVEVSAVGKDPFFHRHRHDGLFDFVEELVTPGEKEEGIRLDEHNQYAFTIVTQSVRFENVRSLIGQLASLNRMLRES